MSKRLSYILLVLALATMARAKDKTTDYQIGIFQGAVAQSDGTITNTLHGDGTTIAGSVHSNYVRLYHIKVDGGTWTVEPEVEAQDSMLRNWGMTPAHFKKEKQNPLDLLKTGDKVMFRLTVRHALNGKFTRMEIPYADNPNKEFAFATRFEPDAPSPETQKPTDNVTAMCKSGKLSPEQQQQFCSPK
jgi:hypothetical protein